jgi:hypothetical protein
MKPASLGPVAVSLDETPVATSGIDMKAIPTTVRLTIRELEKLFGRS